MRGLLIRVNVDGLRALRQLALDRDTTLEASASHPMPITDFAAFRAWCADRGVPALPAAVEIVVAFIAPASAQASLHSLHLGAGP